MELNIKPDHDSTVCFCDLRRYFLQLVVARNFTTFHLLAVLFTVAFERVHKDWERADVCTIGINKIARRESNAYYLIINLLSYTATFISLSSQVTR